MGEETVEKSDQYEFTELADEWVVRAWKLWAGGLKNWSAIAREVGKDRVTVKKRVVQYQQALSAMYDDPDTDPRIELIEGLQQDLQAQIIIAGQAEQPLTVREGGGTERVEKHPDHRTRSMARKNASDTRKDIGAVRGVTTSRGHQTHEVVAPKRVSVPVFGPGDPIAVSIRSENEIYDNAPDEPVDVPDPEPETDEPPAG